MSGLANAGGSIIRARRIAALFGASVLGMVALVASTVIVNEKDKNPKVEASQPVLK